VQSQASSPELEKPKGVSNAKLASSSLLRAIVTQQIQDGMRKLSLTPIIVFLLQLVVVMPVQREGLDSSTILVTT
jgi:membrane-anchored glycerophosphoryl diester phosphodiesterase (GDPDase)